MKFIKKFESFISEAAPSTKPAPTIAPTKPTTKPEPPTKPFRPEKPGKIERPSQDPDPKAKKKKVTEYDVAARFIEEIKDKGESIEKYMKK